MLLSTFELSTRTKAYSLYKRVLAAIGVRNLIPGRLLLAHIHSLVICVVVPEGVAVKDGFLI